MKKVFRDYLARIGAVVIVFCGVVIATTLSVDPYSLYHHEGTPSPGDYSRIVKPHAIRRVRPRLLLAGSSRAEITLDPDLASAAFAVAPAYNIALAGLSAYELLRNIEHACAVTPVEVLVVGLDFYMFNARDQVHTGFDEGRLAITLGGKSNWTSPLRDLPATLLSFSALRDARQGLRAKASSLECEDRWKANGLRVPLAYECRLERPEGQIRMFRETLREYLTKPDLYGEFLLDRRPLPSNSLAVVERIVTSRPPVIILYISPIHALQLLAIERSGHWPEFEEWKRGMTRIVGNATRAGRNVRLVDFTGIDPWSGSPLEFISPGASAAFYDASHLRTEHNARIVEALARGSSSQWGQALTEDRIEEHLRKIRAALARWEFEHPVETVFLEELSRENGE